MDNPYAHKQILMRMQALADKYELDRKEMFRPLMLARKVLTNKCEEAAFNSWLASMTELNEVLCKEDDTEIIYEVLAMVFYKFKKEIKAAGQTSSDQIISQVGLEDMAFYEKFYDESMQQYAHYTKAIEMMEKRTELLLEIAEDSLSGGTARVSALKELTKYAEGVYASGGQPIHINADQALIGINQSDVGKNDWSKLEGYGDESFRKRLKENDKDIIDASD